MKCQRVICPNCKHEYMSIFNDPSYTIKSDGKETDGYLAQCPKCKEFAVVVLGDKYGKSEKDYSKAELKHIFRLE